MSFPPPPGYRRIKMVESFAELIGTPFGDGVNALCWIRELPGDFGEITAQLGVGEGIRTIEEPELASLALSEAGKAAREIVIADQQLLRGVDLEPNLDCVYSCPRDASGGPVPTDVYSFHVDSATSNADTYLCTYAGATSEGLRNEEARQRIDVPEIRAELLKLYGGPDDEAFIEYLREECFDRHYEALPNAQVFTFGVGNLWRIAIEYPGCLVPPCIHRAPATVSGERPRLLLIS